MTSLEAILIGIVQGATEFLPISSSGHMVLVQSLLGIEPDGLLLEVALHLGTLAAVLILFRRDLLDILRGWFGGMRDIARGTPFAQAWRERDFFRWGWYIVLGSLPVAIIGLTLRHHIEGMFANPILTAVMIFFTGEILWLTRPHSLVREEGRLRLSDSLVIGTAQAFALIPGISRSGSTISAALVRGVDREKAARFSFILSVPAIFGATILEAPHLSALSRGEALPLLFGAMASLITGYIALRFLMRVVKAARLHWFAYYCWGVSILAVTWFWAMSDRPY